MSKKIPHAIKRTANACNVFFSFFGKLSKVGTTSYQQSQVIVPSLLRISLRLGMHRKLGPMYRPVNAFQHKTQQLFCDYFLTHAFETFNVK